MAIGSLPAMPPEFFSLIESADEMPPHMPMQCVLPNRPSNIAEETVVKSNTWSVPVGFGTVGIFRYVVFEQDSMCLPVQVFELPTSYRP